MLPAVDCRGLRRDGWPSPSDHAARIIGASRPLGPPQRGMNVMTTSIRSILALTAIAFILAACATVGAVDPSPSLEPSIPASPSAPPSEAPTPTHTPEPIETPEPTETPDASPEPIGTLTPQDGAVYDGPGVPLAEVLEGDLSNAVFVIGTLVLDTEGQLFFTDAVTDATVPTFGDVRLRVDNYPINGPTWDVAEADITGLQEVNGVRFFEDTKFYAVIALDE